MKTDAKRTELEKKLAAEIEGRKVPPETENGAAESNLEGSSQKVEDSEAVLLETTDDEETVIEDQIATVTAERDDLNDRLLRKRAEFENYRRRTARESERMRNTAAKSVIGELLPVVDNLERALSHADDDSGGFVEGVKMVLKNMCDVLAGHGLTPIPALGEPFDPNVHEAISQQSSEEHPADVVMEELQHGYRLGDYVLRPVKVIVSNGPLADQKTMGQDTEEQGLQQDETTADED